MAGTSGGLSGACPTGGVDEPSLDGMEIEESDEVDETGDGIATLVLVVTPLLGSDELLVEDCTKFGIVCMYFLLVSLPMSVVDGLFMVATSATGGSSSSFFTTTLLLLLLLFDLEVFFGDAGLTFEFPFGTESAVEFDSILIST